MARTPSMRIITPSDDAVSEVTSILSAIDTIACTSSGCMRVWAILCPLILRARNRPPMFHNLMIAMHQISVFRETHAQTKKVDTKLLEIAVDVLGGSSCSSSDEECVANSPVEEYIDVLSRDKNRNRLPFKKRYGNGNSAYR